jgi:hypothetical protein
MRNQRLRHDVAMKTMQEIMSELKEDLPYGRRLQVCHLLYFSVRAALETFEELADRQERRLRPGRN